MSDNPSDAGLPRHLDPRAGGARRHSHRAGQGRHLTDNPLPPELDPRGTGGRHGRHSSGYYKRRGGPLAVTGKVAAAVLSVTVFVSSGLMWATTGRNLHPQQINAIPSNDGLGDKKKDIDGKSQNILIVGNDSRAGLSAKELQEVGTDATPGLDTDTILLVHLPADGSKATIISFPRDSYVDIPGYKKNKINSAYADGACLPAGKPERDCGSALSKEARSDGAQELIKTISELTQVHIDHYVEVSLLGFYTISKALGGVHVCLARRWYDPQYEKGIDYPPGDIKLEGKLALAFVRERHGLPGGDLDRIRRQQAFIGALVRKVLSAGTLLNPIKLNRMVKAVSNSLTLDSGLNPFDLLDQMRNVAAGNVTFMTIPNDGPGKTDDGKDVLYVNPAEVRAFVDKVIGIADPAAPRRSHKPTPPRTVPRSSVTVTVENGTLRDSLAETTGTALAAAGFQVGDTINADRQDYPKSVIQYGSGGAAAARTLAAVIPGATLQSDESVTDGVRLILGANFTSVKTTASPTPPHSTPTPNPSGTRSPKVEERTASSRACVN